MQQESDEVTNAKNEAEDLKTNVKNLKTAAKKLSEEAQQIHDESTELREEIDEIVEDSKELHVVVKELKQELSEIKKAHGEAEEFKNKYYYLAAEMENQKRRFEKERENLLKFGTEKILSGLLDVIDNFERTVTAISGDNDDKVKNIRTGIEMVRDQFLNILSNNGLTVIEAVGKKFDPNYHEALGQKESDKHEEETIIEEYQKGYLLNGRLLRASKVVIVKK